ncbi:MAG TPA: hypothetical protein VL915_07110, partial [Gemmatimonadales bacterium]|nr:hypothetical protein [Gemmatimonadales bacterium]
GRALAKDPEERIQTAAEFRDAAVLGGREPAPRRRSRRWMAAAALLVATLLVLGGVLLRRESASTLDPDVVAVAPFEVLAPTLALWREGMVDLLSRNLDGAGSLRTVAPSTVIRRWSGRADPPSAQELGRRTGAGLAVFGQLVPARADSVRLTATLLDVASGRRLAELEFRDAGTSIDDLTDSLTVGLLRALSHSRAIGAVRSTALRATSLPALKAFLQGEQLFRRAAWDSALAAYQRAVDIDSGFALAWRRMGGVVGWHVIAGDSLAEVYGFRGGQLNHGLPPRDSLLVAADSLSAALYQNSNDTLWRAHQARVFAILEEATRRYPADPEVWFELGDARLHFRQIGRVGLEETLAPFDSAIAADSAFGLSYIHPVMLAIQMGRPELVQRYSTGFLNHLGTDQHAHSLRLTDQILSQASGRTPELERAVSTAPVDVLFPTIISLWSWPDSLETAVWLARKMAERAHGVRVYTTEFGTWWLSGNLAFRGHLKEAYAVGGDSLAPVAGIAVLGNGPPKPAVAALLSRWLRNPPIAAGPTAIPYGFNIQLFDALPWWAARHDTLSLAAFAGRMKALESRTPADVLPWLRYGAASAEAYRSLARGDTAAALTRFTSLPDTVCPCAYDQIVTAQLLLQRRREREAAAVFEKQLPAFMSPAEGLWRLQRARVFERLGKRDAAIKDYQFTAAVWRHADTELQPYVTEARQALARLTEERR